MYTFTIRKATLPDVEILQRISRQTFSETFFGDNTEENMKRYLEQNLSIEQLRSEMANPYSEFYFAVSGETIAGYLKINLGQAQTELKGENSMEIERIYVLKEFQRRQVGQLLYNHALQLARQSNVHFIWLGVWEKNSKAIHFYKKNGFVEFGTHIFRLGNDEQTDIMMKLPLE